MIPISFVLFLDEDIKCANAKITNCKENYTKEAIIFQKRLESYLK